MKLSFAIILFFLCFLAPRHGIAYVESHHSINQKTRHQIIDSTYLALPKKCIGLNIFNPKPKNKAKRLACFIKVLKKNQLKKAIKQGNLKNAIKIQNRIVKLEIKLAKALQTEAAVVKRRGTFGGTWSTNLGTTIIAQFDDGSASGTWTDPSSGDLGSLSGFVSGLSFNGSWSFNGESGNFSMSLKKKNANSFQGYCGVTWVGSRQ